MKKTVSIIILFTLIGKFTGFLREIVMSARIGANAFTDVYNLSITASVLLSYFVTTGINAALIPILSEAEIQGRKTSFFNRLLSALIPLLLLGVLALYLLTPLLMYVIGFGLKPDMRVLAIRYSRILSINLLTISLQALLTAYLQKSEKFFFPASMALPLNASVILGILLSRPDNIFPLVLGTILGQLLCLVWLAVPVLRMGYRPKLIAKPQLLKDELGVRFLQMIAPTLVGTIAYQLNTLVDRSFASLLPSGNVSYLLYADKLQGIIYSIMVVSLITVLFPKLAEYASKKDFQKLFAATRENLSYMLLLVVPLSLGLMFLSGEITQIAYMRYEFTIEDAFVTGNILLCYGGIVLFQSTAEMFSRMLFAMKETKKQMIAALVSIGTNIGMNLLLIGPLGVYGLALATTIAAMVRMITLILMSRPYYRAHSENMSVPSLGKYAAAGAVMIGVLFGFRILSGGWPGLVGYAFFSVIIGTVTYFSTLFLMKTEELHQMKQMTISFFDRMRRSA